MKIYNGNVLDWAKIYKGEKFHALLCDPPYEIGFMTKSWDDTGIAFNPETWRLLGEHLLPGAFGMAFSSSRTWHRMAVAIEDAGFIMHPTIFGWIFGSGFPKATRLDTQLDAAAGIEVAHGKEFNMKGKAGHHRADKFEENGRTHVHHEAKSELGKIWAGHRYGRQAMKPAMEPIIVFQKPYRGRAVESIASTGAGALNIEGSRIPVSQKEFEKLDNNRKANRTIRAGAVASGFGMKPEGLAATEQSPNGRWPTNFIISDKTAPLLDKQSGTSKSAKYGGDGKPLDTCGADWGFKRTPGGFEDEGGASRFFFNVQTTLDEAEPAFYCPKASRSEREAGLEGQEEKPFGFSGGANKQLAKGEENYEEGQDIGLNRIRKVRNNHPTVKPINLCEHLATLLLPPDAYAPRRILVPFSGSGSEMIGCGRAGWENVTGVELTPEYVEIALARLRHHFPEKNLGQTPIIAVPPLEKAPPTSKEVEEKLATLQEEEILSGEPEIETDVAKYDRLVDEEIDGRKLTPDEILFIKSFSKSQV